MNTSAAGSGLLEKQVRDMSAMSRFHSSEFDVGHDVILWGHGSCVVFRFRGPFGRWLRQNLIPYAMTVYDFFDPVGKTPKKFRQGPPKGVFAFAYRGKGPEGSFVAGKGCNELRG